jgi:hypothetical protein
VLRFYENNNFRIQCSSEAKPQLVGKRRKRMNSKIKRVIEKKLKEKADGKDAGATAPSTEYVARHQSQLEHCFKVYFFYFL